MPASGMPYNGFMIWSIGTSGRPIYFEVCKNTFISTAVFIGIYACVIPWENTSVPGIDFANYSTIRLENCCIVGTLVAVRLAPCSLYPWVISRILCHRTVLGF